jgi:hypothetical protein
MLAHSQPNEVISQLRNFDVVLMVLLIGCSYYISNSKKQINYMSYVKKRFVRLIIPTWIFISIFFIVFYLISVLRAENYYFGLNQIVGSYTIMNGINSIGFIWIMRVFFIIALVCPVILIFSNRIKNNLIYFLYLSVYYFIYALLILFSGKIHGLISLFYINIIIYGVGYSFIAAIGIRLPIMNKKEVDFLCVAFMFLSLLLMYHNNFAYTQQFKYPPTIYYISYGMFVSLLLYRLLDFQIIEKVFNNVFVRFVSITSAWIYFWHIIFCYIIMLFGTHISFITSCLAGRFLFLLSGALFVTYIHELIKAKIKRKSISY